jgi:hypothetical protein
MKDEVKAKLAAASGWLSSVSLGQSGMSCKMKARLTLPSYNHVLECGAATPFLVC